MFVLQLTLPKVAVLQLCHILANITNSHRLAESVLFKKMEGNAGQSRKTVLPKTEEAALMRAASSNYAGAYSPGRFPFGR